MSALVLRRGRVSKTIPNDIRHLFAGKDELSAKSEAKFVRKCDTVGRYSEAMQQDNAAWRFNSAMQLVDAIGRCDRAMQQGDAVARYNVAWIPKNEPPKMTHKKSCGLRRLGVSKKRAVSGSFYELRYDFFF